MAHAGSLTTTFTAPASCTTATGLYQIWASNTYHFEQGPLASMTDCFPSGYDAAATSRYYSPGVCPSGYTTACSRTGVLSASATETAYTCCPRGRVEYTCAASATGSSSLGCTTQFGGQVGISFLTAISEGSTYSTAVIASSGQGIGAHGIAVRVRSGDLTPELVLATTTSRTSSSPTSSSSPATSGGLSKVEITGIGLGAGALVLAIAGTLAFFLWMRRQKQRALKPLSPRYSPPTCSKRGPPPPRPPRPLAATPLGPRAPRPPSPPPKHTVMRNTVMPMPPSPSTTSSDFNKAREVDVYTVRNIETRKKPPRRAAGPLPLLLDGSSSKKSPSSARDTTSTFGTLVNGPFELPGEVLVAEYDDDDEKEKTRGKARYMHDMHELYGGDEWQQTPPPAAVTTGQSGVLSLYSHSLATTTVTSAELEGSYPASPPTQQGFVCTAPTPPPRSLDAAHRPLRRLPSGRWGRGTSWAPAELPAGERGCL